MFIFLKSTMLSGFLFVYLLFPPVLGINIHNYSVLKFDSILRFYDQLLIMLKIKLTGGYPLSISMKSDLLLCII